MNKIFVIVNCYFETYSPEYFLGPENISQSEFQSICDSLLETASNNALLNKNNEDYIGNEEIIKEMIPLLKDKGFEHFSPHIYECFGANIFYDLTSFPRNKEEFISENTKNSIIDYNGKIYKYISRKK
jgi:hypothetical protein